jgi:hypothetical protein
VITDLRQLDSTAVNEVDQALACPDVVRLAVDGGWHEGNRASASRIWDSSMQAIDS